MSDYFQSLSAETRESLGKLAQKYLGSSVISSTQQALDVLSWMELEADISLAHIDWLERARTVVETAGLEWNRDNYLRYCELENGK